MQTPCGGPGASRARAASPGLCGARTPPPPPRSPPTLPHGSCSSMTACTEGSLKAWPGMGRPHIGPTYSEGGGAGDPGDVLYSRGVRGLSTAPPCCSAAWKPMPGSPGRGGKPESAEGTGALGKPISAAQAESAAVVLTGKGSPPAHCQALDRVPLEAECPTPAGHHHGNRQERTCLLPPLEKWSPSWV